MELLSKTLLFTKINPRLLEPLAIPSFPTRFSTINTAGIEDSFVKHPSGRKKGVASKVHNP